MGVVSVSSTAPFGLTATFSNHPSPTKRITILAFKTTDKTKNTNTNTDLVTSKENPKRRTKKPSERVHALSTPEAPYCSLDLDYHEAAAQLNRLYNLSPTTIDSDTDDQLKNTPTEITTTLDIVRGQHKKFHRLTLQNRIHLKNHNKDVKLITSNHKRKRLKDNEEETLVTDYSASTDLGSLDWKKMKIPPVLPSSEHSRLFKLLQTMKVKISQLFLSYFFFSLFLTCFSFSFWNRQPLK